MQGGRTMVEVKLTPSQIMMAAHCGTMRQTMNLKNRKPATYGAGHLNDWQLHIEGCLGEMAVASYLNLYWDGNLGFFSKADVGSLEVRTASNHRYNLILHPADKDDSKFILLTGVNGSYQIHGWIYGREGKKEEFWRDPLGGRPAFFVGKEHLHPIETIRNGTESTSPDTPPHPATPPADAASTPLP